MLNPDVKSGIIHPNLTENKHSLARLPPVRPYTYMQRTETRTTRLTVLNTLLYFTEEHEQAA